MSSSRSRVHRFPAPAAGAVLALALLAAGCTKKEADAKAASGSGAGGRNRSVVLAQSDVADVKTGSISDGILITGTLRPLESVDVRARIEGDLTGVFVREGQQVSQGQLLAQFEAVTQQSSAASAQAGQAAARADLSQAQWNLKQTGDLFKAGAVSEAEYRAAQQAVDAANARLAAAVAAERAAAVSARDTRVVAPISGTIEQKLVNGGEHLARGAAMFTLVRNRTLELAATVPERRANAVQVGQRVAFVADGREFDGRVARVSPTIDPASRSITVYVDVDNSNGALKGNSLATGSVLVKTVSDALIIPASALRQSADTGAAYVYRVNTGKVQQAPVTVGIVDNRAGIVQITSGLSVGDRVVVGNVGTLAPGAEVQIVGGDREGRRK
jgi:RND family efflux transporter MFP subunit